MYIIFTIKYDEKCFVVVTIVCLLVHPPFNVIVLLPTSETQKYDHSTELVIDSRFVFFQELDLSSNGIAQLDTDIFFGNAALKVLSLAGNVMSNMSASIKHMEDLHMLDLSNNRCVVIYLYIIVMTLKIL